ncbi:MAG: DUF4373 domain-containing protein [Clostridia bacterium]|nr:DUF4373 domain-containing protein [Clostridia bacterium]
MRPKKNGLDYFSLDIEFDDEVMLIDAKFGCEGLCILIKLWQIIYKNGYYVQWGEREVLLYKKRINADINLINDVINECLKWDIFNEKLYKKYGILTSSGIQKRFIEATQRRTDIEFIKEYLLIKNVKTLYPRKDKKGKLKVNVNIIGVNDDKNEVNDDKSTQRESKEKEKVNRKERESKEKEKVNKNIYADFVKMTEEEYKKLVNDFGELKTIEKIEDLSLYKGSTGKKYTSDYLTILSWDRKNKKDNETKSGSKNNKPSNTFFAAAREEGLL